MVPPENLRPLVSDKANGDISVRAALAQITKNNEISLENSRRFLALQNWINKTNSNIEKANKSN
jgi:hypothetical protein